jgi:hypothetical protein
MKVTEWSSVTLDDITRRTNTSTNTLIEFHALPGEVCFETIRKTEEFIAYFTFINSNYGVGVQPPH